VNVHNVASAFITAQPLLDFVERYDKKFRRGVSAPRPRLTDSAFRAISKQLQVRYRYTPHNSTNVKSRLLTDPPQSGRLKHINGFGRAANIQTFQLDKEGKTTTITVEDYFNQHVLQVPDKVQYPDLLCVNTGSTQGPVWVPPEILYIEPHQAKRER
jgi:hypothetical protein